MKKTNHTKKAFAILLATILALGLAACGTANVTTTEDPAESPAEAVVDSEISAREATESCEIKTEDGSFQTSEDEAQSEAGATESDGTSEQEEPPKETSSDAGETTEPAAEPVETTTEPGKDESGGSTVIDQNSSVYTITSAGTYTLSGLLEGQILVDAGEDDEVVIELAGATITCGEDSPIKAISAGKVEISAKKGTENVVNDTRSVKTADDATQGEGAIYATCDLKIKGNGTLVVNAAYNNGIHTTKDLSIQNLSLKVTAYNNALKGNDSITVTSGTVAAISTNGDGVKTENTDLNKNGVTRGDILLTGGTVTVYAAGDGFQAAHNFEMTAGEEGLTPTVTVYTGSYSGYTASGATTTSYKGVKVQNELNIKDGSITLQTYDDGLHADYGTSFADGTKGSGTVNISGGTVSMSVYAPESKTAGGRMGPGWGGWGGWGGQQTVAGADAIHADSVLNISGGTITIDSAYEGLEANVINVSGGKTVVAANDDGVNACKGITTPAVNVTGGYLDVSVSPNGDTDGIDSNGTYRQSGGVVVTRGPNNQNMAAIDADSSVIVSGGTLIVLGYGRVSTSGSVKTYSLSVHSSGSHTVTIGGTKYTFTNANAYGSTTCYSDVSVSA
ncbi:MAG: carbohydrate-binding domain-containing protein [Clostridia bacterium]|nr:carbohydrate-binding domain-containing protein [Clostridia bacterium]